MLMGLRFCPLKQKEELGEQCGVAGVLAEVQSLPFEDWQALTCCGGLSRQGEHPQPDCKRSPGAPECRGEKKANFPFCLGTMCVNNLQGTRNNEMQ